MAMLLKVAPVVIRPYAVGAVGVIEQQYHILSSNVEAAEAEAKRLFEKEHPGVRFVAVIGDEITLQASPEVSG